MQENKDQGTDINTRLKNDVPSKVKIMKVQYIVNHSDTIQNCVWMNSKDIEELFNICQVGKQNTPSSQAQTRHSYSRLPYHSHISKTTTPSKVHKETSNHAGDAPRHKYVRIGNRVYAAIKRSGLEIGEILINPIQFRESIEGISNFTTHDTVAVEAFKQETQKSALLHQGIFLIGRHDHEINAENDVDEQKHQTSTPRKIVLVDLLRNSFQANNLSDYLKKGQQLMQLLRNGSSEVPLAATLISANIYDDAISIGEAPFYRISRTTQLEFVAEAHSGIALIDNVIESDDIDSFDFTVTPFKKAKPSSVEGWKTSIQPLPLALSVNDIESAIRYALDGKTLLKNEKNIVPHNGEWDLEITFNDAKLKQYSSSSNSGSSSRPGVVSPLSLSMASNYQSAYQFTRQSQIKPNPGEGILFVDDQAQEAKEAHLEIVDFQNMQGIPYKNAPFVLERDLKKELQKIKPSLANGQRIAIEVPSTKCLLELKGPSAKGVLHKIDENTQMKFSVKASLPVVLGDHANSLPIKKLQVTACLEKQPLSILSKSAYAEQTFNEEQLEKMFFEKLTEDGIFIGQRIQQQLDDGDKLIFTVVEMAFDEAAKKANA